MPPKSSGGSGPWKWELSDTADPSVGIFGDTYTVFRSDENNGDFFQILVSSEVEAELYCHKLNEAEPLIVWAEENARDYLEALKFEHDQAMAEDDWERQYE